jgi:hypothetical protein
VLFLTWKTLEYICIAPLLFPTWEQQEPYDTDNLSTDESLGWLYNIYSDNGLRHDGKKEWKIFTRVRIDRERLTERIL